MTLRYQAVGWNPQKKAYDRAALGGVLLWIVGFVGVGLAIDPHTTAETLLIRAFGTAALVLLHVVLAIGPLCRLDRRFLPLLYNRRHLGVLTFALGAIHGLFSLVQFHALGNVDPLVSLLASETRFDSLHHFPFHVLGAGALAILFAMAATSHDFWLENLSPRIWKALHMGVYLAYALLIAHVALGALQTERHVALAAILVCGVVALVTLHLIAGTKEVARDGAPAPVVADGFVDVAAVGDIPLHRARVCVARAGGERIAVFRHERGFSAISNVCRHQGGPLGEGRILDGCVTCPWHGYQYLVESGTSPPPFTEKVETYRVRVRQGRVEIDPHALPPGTPLPPAIEGDS
jgi:methionine sulfoxide reductase heme-binding subunit